MFMLFSKGSLPFFDENEARLITKIKEDTPDYENLKAPAEALDLLKNLLYKDPAGRLSAKQALEHRWFIDSRIFDFYENQ